MATLGLRLQKSGLRAATGPILRGSAGSELGSRHEKVGNYAYRSMPCATWQALYPFIAASRKIHPAGSEFPREENTIVKIKIILFQILT
jgi:hypothetical protein